MSSMTGLDEFKKILSEFKGLALWTAGASVVLPFIADFTSVIPPWPNGLAAMTAVFQLVALAFAYQKYRGAPRTLITRNMRMLFILLFIVILIYFGAFSAFTVYIPTAERSLVIGFQCLPEAAAVYTTKCPFLGLPELAAVSFDELELWTRSSITLTRSLLITLWFAFFIVLASLLGQFLVYQMGRRIPTRVTAKQQQS